MPSVIKLVRLATLPETRRAVVVAARSNALRDLAQRARSDRTGLLRDLAHPTTAVGLIRDAIRHPATRELASLGYLLLPDRYTPVGWAAAWLSRRVSRRLIDRRTSKAARPMRHPGPPPRGVTPRRTGRPAGWWRRAPSTRPPDEARVTEAP